VISVVLVAREGLAREALEAALELNPGMSVDGLDGEPETVIAAIREASPHVVLLHVPTTDGVVHARTLRMAGVEARVVALDVEHDERAVRAWADAGVSGCFLRGTTLSELGYAIERIASGEVMCSPEAGGLLLRSATTRRPAPFSPSGSDDPDLTPREVDVVELAAAGLSNKQIAGALRIELSTVKNHLQSIFKKFGVRSRRELQVAVQLPRANITK
jgi:DNA-binding NarL/FixJ family response regulator